MPKYKVRCYDEGVWDQIAPVEIDARTMMDAAETVCGCNLCRIPHEEDRLRAAVWVSGTIPEPMFFYVQHEGAGRQSRPPVSSRFASPERAPTGPAHAEIKRH